MGKKGYSEPGLFGGYTHYDENGKKVGRSEPGLFGGFTEYDSHGNITGHSEPGLFGGYTHYDRDGHVSGHSEPGLFGSYTHYDKDGKATGTSDPGLFGSYTTSDGGGCYIATCVYGSYEAPEVRLLRRYRDEFLKPKAAGRLFIRIYYAVSPWLVRRFGGNRLFRKFWKTYLDKRVERLRKK